MAAEHVGELAELYALGTLEPLEARRVDAHVRSCAECAARLGEAEATVMRLIQRDAPSANDAELRALQLERRGAPVWSRRAPLLAALAAAFLIGLLPPSVVLVRERGEHSPPQTQSAAVAMLAGHFAHVPLLARVATAPKAKAIYPLEGGWIYVIAAPDPALDIAVVRAGAETTVSSLPMSSGVRTAFAAVGGKIDAVELLQRGSVVASARIAR